MTDEPDDHNEYDDDCNCPWCGGEGFVFDCFDGCCEDCDVGCDDCTRDCPECTQRTVRDTGDALGQVLAEALNVQQPHNKTETK